MKRSPAQGNSFIFPKPSPPNQSTGIQYEATEVIWERWGGKQLIGHSQGTTAL